MSFYFCPRCGDDVPESREGPSLSLTVHRCARCGAGAWLSPSALLALGVCAWGAGQLVLCVTADLIGDHVAAIFLCLAALRFARRRRARLEH